MMRIGASCEEGYEDDARVYEADRSGDAKELRRT
jgi:hypothetical protein